MPIKYIQEKEKEIWLQKKKNILYLNFSSIATLKKQR